MGKETKKTTGTKGGMGSKKRSTKDDGRNIAKPDGRNIAKGYPNWPKTDYKYRSDMTIAELAAAFPKDALAHAKAALSGIRKGIKDTTGFNKGGMAKKK